MGEAYLFGTGGGDNLKNAFAIISVEYPNGSTLICTNAETGKTYKAGNTYGQWAFGVNSAGTWTLESFNGTDYESSSKKKTVTVEITEQYQSTHVNIVYGYYLYEDGPVNGYTFGVWHDASASVTNYDTYMRWAVGSYTAFRFICNQSIDVSMLSKFGYTTLNIEMSNINVYSMRYMYWGIGDNSTGDTNTFRAYVNQTTFPTSTITIPLGTLTTGNVYFKVRGLTNQGSTYWNAHIHKIWFE